MREIDLVCYDCKHFHEFNSDGQGWCKAFPNHVPYGFGIGEHGDHKEPFIDAENYHVEGETVTQEGDYVFEWVCGDCAHSHRYHSELGVGCCLAYPNGIDAMDETMLGKNHIEPYIDQKNDYVYTPHKD
jgi:hypothetical protein